ncbi:glycosyltransferase family 2 protein [Aliagarivorans marinus]|uniref:glycosyltransferase family 2 protein n=1 Tax=Aliagarivorans marinus TaxID=561965 RepID=UPI0004108A09|nr:glycosyltransferase [Aliagarivorans marinus]
MPKTASAPIDISVVIASYNARNTVAKAIDSVLLQAGVSVEVIVVDDGSTDGSGTWLLANYGEQIRYHYQANAGVSRARNQGLAIARGESVLFLDADDWLLPGALSPLHRRLRSLPEQVVACYGRLLWVAGPEAPRQWVSAREMPSGYVTKALLNDNFIVNGGCMLIRRAAIARCGGFCHFLRLGEDWEFWFRLSLQGQLLSMPQLVVSAYRIHQGANLSLRRMAPQLRHLHIHRVYQHPWVAANCGRLERVLRRRYAKSIVFWEDARQSLKQRGYLRFGWLVVAGLCRYPESMIQVKRAYRLLKQAI